MDELPRTRRLPTSAARPHGRERVRRLCGRAYGSGGGFDVVIHTISADGPSVLTERTDFLTFRKLHMEFWVCGRFDVRDGQIVDTSGPLPEPETLLAAPGATA